MERRLIGYVRVAPRERVGSRPGLSEQREAIRAACAARGWRLVRIEEDVRSGRTRSRRGLQAALAACKAGEADGIVVARLDRLTYSLADLAAIALEAVEQRFSIVALDVDLDLASDSGRVAGAVLAEAARWRPRAIARGIRAVSGARRPGRPSSTPPEVARRIRRLRAGGATLQAICDTLNAEGVPTPRHGTHWRPTSLRAILRTTEGGNE